MARLEVLRAADYPTVPWKNGGGITREVAGAPSISLDEGFQWRVSIADVGCDGPFSVFPDVDRILTLIEPAEVTLWVDGVEHHLTYLEPFAFPGGAATTARLEAGPTRDLNVMTSHATARASVDIVRGGATVAAGDSEAVLAVVVAGSAAISIGDLSIGLHRLDSARLEPGGDFSLLTIEPEAAVAVIRVASIPE
jgi:environmental stress-induced protein Ves